MPRLQRIDIHPEAPPKPPAGAACNGCGVCCSAGPCPLGMGLSRRVHGACAALHWRDGRYVCGAIAPARAATGWRRWPQALRVRWARRLIGAGRGCDCTLEVVAGADPAPPQPELSPPPAPAPAPPRTRA